MESYDNFLNSHECLSLINYTKDLNPTVDKKTGRNLEFFFNDDYQGFEFLSEKFNKIGIINKPKFNINKYKKGFFFLPHYDSSKKNNYRTERLKTLIINLSNTNEYTGGDLIVGKKEIKIKQGTALIFNSNVIHEVKTVTEGLRYSLVSWLGRENISDTLIKKGLI